MAYLGTQITIWLALAVALGFVIGFLLRGLGVNKRLDMFRREMREAKSEARALRKRVKELETDLAQQATETAAPVVVEAEPSSEPQDLKKIRGIGPAIEKKLHALEITHYAQIANFSTEDIERINGKLNFKGRIEREKWIEQAAELASA